MLPASGMDAGNRLHPSVQALPAGRTDALSLGEGNGVYRQPTLVTLSGGGFMLVYSRHERGDMDSSSLRVVVSTDGSAISDSIPLAFGGEVEDAPSLVTTQDGTWLYFASDDGSLESIKLWPSRLVGESLFSSGQAGGCTGSSAPDSVAALGRGWSRCVPDV